MTTTIKLKVNPYYSGTKELDGNVYKLKLRWNMHTEIWYLDLTGLTNDVDIKGIALLPGKDLLASHGYYQLGQLWVIDNQGANENPNYDDIGTRFTLEYTAVDG